MLHLSSLAVAVPCFPHVRQKHTHTQTLSPMVELHQTDKLTHTHTPACSGVYTNLHYWRWDKNWCAHTHTSATTVDTFFTLHKYTCQTEKCMCVHTGIICSVARRYSCNVSQWKPYGTGRDRWHILSCNGEAGVTGYHLSLAQLIHNRCKFPIQDSNF